MPGFWEAVVLIAVSMVLVGIGIKWIEHARNEAHRPGETRDEDLLGPIRTAFEAGLMREEEYQKAREALGLPATDPTIPRRRPPAPPPSNAPPPAKEPEEAGPTAS